MKEKFLSKFCEIGVSSVFNSIYVDAQKRDNESKGSKSYRLEVLKSTPNTGRRDFLLYKIRVYVNP